MIPQLDPCELGRRLRPYSRRRRPLMHTLSPRALKARELIEGDRLARVQEVRIYDRTAFMSQALTILAEARSAECLVPRYVSAPFIDHVECFKLCQRDACVGGRHCRHRR